MNQHLYVDILNQSLIKYASLPCLHIKRDGVYKSWTYQQFHEDLNRLTSLLKKQGLKHGKNAIVIGENSPEWLIAHHSIFLTGACTIPVDPNIPQSEIESIALITEAKVVFCTPTYHPLFKELKSKYSFIDKIILLDTKLEHKDRFDTFVKNGDVHKDAFKAEFHPDDPLVILFTSGTTGKSKGVVLCQKNFTAVAVHAVSRIKLTSNDTACAVLPLHHVFGCAASLIGPLGAGSDIVFVPFIKGPLILEALRDKEVTYLPVVPKMLALFYDSIIHNVKIKGPAVQSIFAGMKTISSTVGERFGNTFKRKLFSSVHKSFGGKLRLIISGGAALNKKHWVGFRQMGFTIVEGYGLTETFGPITVPTCEDVRLGSVGPVLNENEIRIDQPNSNGIGEVLLRGTCVFKEYYNNKTQTLEVFDDQGWFYTGDLGHLDKDGFLYLSGRKKDMIVLDSGKNVYPDELEDIFGASPIIEEIGVFGIDKNDSEIVAAVIVPTIDIRKSNTVKQATDLIYSELLRISKSIPVYRRITDFVTIYTPLPRTTTKKLKKQELKKLFTSIKRKKGTRTIDEDQLSVIEMALMETVEYISVVNSILAIVPKIEIGIINPRSHIEIDLNLDSLQRIELLTLIEKQYKIAIPDDLFDKLESVTDLVSLIRENSSDKNAASIDKFIGLKDRIINESQTYITFPKQIPVIEQTTFPLLRKMCNGFKYPKIYGVENLSTIEAPIIFAPNHSHFNDVFAILDSLPPHIRNNSFFFHENGFKKHSLLSSLYQSHILNLDKENDPIEILRVSIAVIRNRKNLIVFPEGSASKPGSLGQFKSGISLLVHETAATIVPVKIVGPLHLSSQKISTNTLSLLFGKPLTYKDLFFDGQTQKKHPMEETTMTLRSIIEKM